MQFWFLNIGLEFHRERKTKPKIWLYISLHNTINNGQAMDFAYTSVYRQMTKEIEEIVNNIV